MLSAAVLAAPWTGHIDDPDAPTYQVVARHMIEDQTWFDLRYLPGIHPQYREHLPFGLWPWAAAIRIGGEDSLPYLAGLFTLSTLIVVMWMARRLGGWTAATLAVLVLGTTESFVIYGGRARLDPLLLLLVTVSVAPLLAPAPSGRRWLFGAVFAAAATLVKGPFGLLPFLAAGITLAVEHRSLRRLVTSVALTALAALPAFAFLFADWKWGARTWWNGYFVDQLLASAAGGRSDGAEPPWFPFHVIATRFWPGLVCVAVGLFHAARRPKPAEVAATDLSRVARRLALFSLLVLVGLAVPQRKLWHHVLVAFPGLAVLGAVGTAPILRRWLDSPARKRAAVIALGFAALGVLLFDIAGGGRLVWLPGVHAGEFRTAFDRVGPGERVLVVSDPPRWSMAATLAAERRLEPWMEPRFAPGVDHGARLALIEVDLMPPHPPASPWRKAGAARGWVLLQRE